jgi:ABC-2 type transport system ATP-binding protein
MIEVEQICKQLGPRRVLDDVSFTVARGELVALVGPNGAGKTTALRIVTGFLDPDRGRVRVAGHCLSQARLAARACIGYLTEGCAIHPDMRVREYLAFRGQLRGLRGRDLRRRIEEVAVRLGLAAELGTLVGRLSKGFRQRTGLADALLGRPAVLVLDEPTNGLDPLQLREFRQLLAQLAPEHAVLLSTHALSEAEALACRVVMLVDGRVLAAGTLAELRDRAGVAAASSLEQVFLALGAPAERGRGGRAAGERGVEGPCAPG